MVRSTVTLATSDMTSGRYLYEIGSRSIPSGAVLLSASPNHTILGVQTSPTLMDHSVSEPFAARDGTAALSFVSSWQPHSIEQMGIDRDR